MLVEISGVSCTSCNPFLAQARITRILLKVQVNSCTLSHTFGKVFKPRLRGRRRGSFRPPGGAIARRPRGPQMRRAEARGGAVRGRGRHPPEGCREARSRAPPRGGKGGAARGQRGRGTRGAGCAWGPAAAPGVQGCPSGKDRSVPCTLSRQGPWERRRPGGGPGSQVLRMQWDVPTRRHVGWLRPCTFCGLPAVPAGHPARVRERTLSLILPGAPCPSGS